MRRHVAKTLFFLNISSDLQSIPPLLEKMLKPNLRIRNCLPAPAPRSPLYPPLNGHHPIPKRKSKGNPIQADLFLKIRQKGIFFKYFFTICYSQPLFLEKSDLVAGINKLID